MQVVAAIGHVINDILREHFDRKEKTEYRGGLQPLVNCLKEIRSLFYDSVKYVVERKDPSFQDVAAKDLVELYGYLIVGYLVLDEAEINSRKSFIANRYIYTALAKARQNAEAIRNGVFADLLHAEKILCEN